jgi:SSS family solute:Na+ symporter
MIAGLVTWLLCVTWKTEYPPILYGLLASGIGMTVGIYCKELLKKAV